MDGSARSVTAAHPDMPAPLTGEEKATPARPTLLFIALAVFMIGFMAVVFAFGIRSTTGDAISPEQYATNLATLLPFGYAFGAGLVASVNPCGFLMVPAFVGYYLGQDTPGVPADVVTVRHLGRAVMFGVMVTLGFVALFSAIGSVIAAGGTAIIDAFPWAGFSIGIVLGLLGLWLLVTGQSMGLSLASRIGRPQGRGILSAFLYGVAYGAASLACTLPIFLVVVGTSLASGGVWGSLGKFASYGLGMGVVLTAVSLSAVAFKGAVAQALKGMVPYVHRLSAIFLAAAGAYMIVYWAVLGDLF